MAKKLTKHRKCQIIVQHFLSYKEKISWPKEIKLAKALLDEIPDYKFWISVQVSEPIGTLSYFKTEEGKAFIQGSLKKHTINLSPVQKEVILGDKIGNDKEAKTKKPKTLMEFLNAKDEERENK